MNSGIKKEKLRTLSFLLFVISLLISASPQTPKKVATFPKTDAIEKELWNLINKERELHKLPLLEFSTALSEMARQHSLDMANQGKPEPSHLSSDGKTLVNRLEDAGIYYVDAGENVAFSETYVAEFIHESFIESKEHRENILDPDFAQIGIGVIHLENKGYYVTQDFLRPMLFKTDNQVRNIILDRINTERRLMDLPSLDLWQEAEQFAQNLTEKKVNGQVLPEIPPEYGETFIVFLSTPSLTQEELDFPEASNPRYNTGALGIWFGKNRDYPGGVYALALMLFAENVYHTLSIEEQKQYILELINKIRTHYGLKLFTLDKKLTKAAERMVSKAARRRSETLIFPENKRYETITYGTTDLALLPESLDITVRNRHLRKIGLGLVYKINPGSQKGTFFISLIFD